MKRNPSCIQMKALDPAQSNCDWSNSIKPNLFERCSFQQTVIEKCRQSVWSTKSQTGRRGDRETLAQKGVRTLSEHGGLFGSLV